MAAIDDWVSKELDQQLVLYGDPPVASPRTAEEKAFVAGVLTRALECGQLDGDGARTVLEYLPGLADALIGAIGITRHQLPGLAGQGLVTADALRAAGLVAAC